MRSTAILRFMLAVAAVPPVGAAPATPPKVLVSYKTQGTRNFDLVDGATGTLSMWMQDRLEKRFACFEVISAATLEDYLRFSKNRALLSTPGSENDLAAFAQALNRDYILHVTGTAVGKQLNVNVVLLNAHTGKAVARDSMMAPLDDEVDVPLQKFADRFIQGIEGPGLRCPGPWHGTVKFKRDFKHTVPGATFTYEGWSRTEVACTVEGPGTRIAKCAASWDQGEKKQCPNGRDCSHASQGKGEALVNMTLEFDGGKVKIGLPSFSVTGENGTKTEILGQAIQEAAAADPRKQTGSKTVEFLRDNTSLGTWTMEWAFARE